MCGCDIELDVLAITAECGGAREQSVKHERPLSERDDEVVERSESLCHHSGFFHLFLLFLLHLFLYRRAVGSPYCVIVGRRARLRGRPSELKLGGSEVLAVGIELTLKREAAGSPGTYNEQKGRSITGISGAQASDTWNAEIATKLKQFEDAKQYAVAGEALTGLADCALGIAATAASAGFAVGALAQGCGPLLALGVKQAMRAWAESQGSHVKVPISANLLWKALLLREHVDKATILAQESEFTSLPAKQVLSSLFCVVGAVDTHITGPRQMVNTRTGGDKASMITEDEEAAALVVEELMVDFLKLLQLNAHGGSGQTPAKLGELTGMVEKLGKGQEQIIRLLNQWGGRSGLPVLPGEVALEIPANELADADVAAREAEAREAGANAS